MIQAIISFIKTFLKTLYSIIVTLPRDLKGLMVMTKIESTLNKHDNNGETVPKLFYKNFKKHPKKPCFIFENHIWTFEDVENYSNKVAHAFSKKYGLQKGDACALFMENKAEYAIIWLGLSKIGVITALINTNLKATALIHSITVANSKILIYGAELTDSVEQVRDELKKTCQFVVQNSNSQTTDTKLETLLENAPSTSYVPEKPVLPTDTIIYIYTSGTTGLPKPAVIKHNRYYGAGVSFAIAPGVKSDDIIYDCLPIYHANGGMIAIGMGLVQGNTVVLRKKFSATNFWKECAQFNCTVIIYVGEVCRYLVNQPTSPFDRQHSVRLAIGNGLRKNIWSDFCTRFGVRVVEFYGASEGNCTIMNITSYPGACGFVPLANRIVKKLAINIIRIDNEMNPIRDKNGLCILCEPYERGLAVGLLGDRSTKEYSGYANNKEASNKKIIDDVFMKGQKAFNSGDMMMIDELGYIYFCDRLGDTYRWRGENVSTVEVENIISSKLNFIEVVVYGVEIPGQEGRAGMATILKSEIDLKKLHDDLKQDLPSYARPLFIRLVDNVDHTGSFRVQKNKLIDLGYDINKVKDKLYYLDTKGETYLPLTSAVYNSILKMTHKF